MEENFQIRDLLQLLLKRLKLLVIIPIIFASIGYSVSTWLITPVYEAKVDLLINNTIIQNDEKFSAADIETNLRLIETYQYIIQSDRVTSLVNDKLNNHYTNKQLKDKLRIETNNNTQIMQLYFKDQNLDTAVKAINLYADIFQAEIKSLMHMENIIVLTKADIHKHKQPVMPKTLYITIISFFIGFISVCLYIAVINFFFFRISSKNDIDKYFSLPFLGLVGKIKLLSRRKKQADLLMLGSRSHPKEDILPASVLEAYRTIRTNLDFLMKREGYTSILITSSTKGEGKTITAANLSQIMALNNQKTILINADLRKEEGLQQTDQIGLSQYLSMDYPIKQLVQTTAIENLQYIAPGVVPMNPSELLASDKMPKLISDLKKDYDRIVIDSPPLFFSDPVILSGIADGCLIVAQAEKTRKSTLQQAINKLLHVNAHLFGIVLNNKKLKKQEKKFHAYYGAR